MAKLMHLADLHLGRKFENHDLLEDQKAVLNEILVIMESEQPDVLMICGDVYDRSIPSADAVTLLGDFLERAGKLCPILLISGNHDSGERLSFASGYLRRQKLYVCGGFDGTLKPVTIKNVNFYMLPYVHPGNVKYALRERNVEDVEYITTMEQAVEAALSVKEAGEGAVNVLLAHLFVTSSKNETETSDSEIQVGTLEKVDSHVFDGFDYVALGHLHRPQNIGRETVRYAGTPLAYSFSEDHQKSVTLVEIENGSVQVRTVPLHSGHRMRTVSGLLEDIVSPDYDAGDKGDYILVKLLDKTLQVDARSRLRQVFPLLIGGIQYPNYEGTVVTGAVKEVHGKDDGQLLDEFWQYKRGESMPEEYKELLLKLLEEEEE